MAKNVWTETPDEAEAEETYLDRERHDHGLELWTLSNIFEEMKPGDDTRYRDFHLAYLDQWKVVTFDITRWNGVDTYLDLDLYAVRR